MLRITDPGRSRGLYEAFGFRFAHEMDIIRNGELEATNYFFSIGEDENVLDRACSRQPEPDRTRGLHCRARDIPERRARERSSDPPNARHGVVEIKPFRPEDARAVASLCAAEGWDFWDDPRAVARALTAPGAATFVALDDGELLGAIEVIGDGEINWIVGMLVVAPHRRGQGIGTRLLQHSFTELRAKRLDLLTEDEGPRFYRRLLGHEMAGFRLYSPSRAPDE